MPTPRPVGQEVKTGASHAPNVGSIPARVTKFAENANSLFTNGGAYAKIIALQRAGKRAAVRCVVSFPLERPVGADNDEGPPVPIPNTEVKLISAYNTWLATAWEDWSVPTQMFLNSSVGRARGC